MQNNLFYGSGTALVTPFRGNRVDYDAMESLIEWQIESGTDAIVILGTTGEPSTLSDAERGSIIECAAACCAGRVPIIVGTGSNDTRTAIRYSVEAQLLGADALLVVTPYYNRASRSGLIEHFTAIADKSDIPIILYNVPSRTGVNLKPETVAELARHPMLCALKDANSEIGHMTEMYRICADGIAIYSGNDEHVLSALALGAHGVISVVSNILPAEMHELTACWIRGDAKSCKQRQFALLPLLRQLAAEVNPIPIKAALSLIGKIENTLRLPLTPLDEEHLQALKREMKLAGLLKN